ncbi:MAG: hypothetical protein GF381_00530 [Candidatus Pacebacteria bacterium]|nr:hypothetical protein [Candidatus Paceibacterota bacterium]
MTKITGQLGKEFIKTNANRLNQAQVKHYQRFALEATKMGRPAELLFERLADLSGYGKKVRAGLISLGYQLAGGQNQSLVDQLGLFIELFHTGLLIHDDLMDQDETRRGQDSLHVQFEKIGQKAKLGDPSLYGLSQAILAGDLAFYLSWQILLESELEPDKLIGLSQAYSSYTTRIVYGQCLDVQQKKIGQLAKADILEVIRLKTAEYSGMMPLEIGAIAGGLAASELDKLKKYGLAFGWAFQVQDDLLGLFGQQKKLGKPIGSDVREGKNTLLMLELFERGSQAQRQRQLELLGKDDISLEEVEEMRQLVKDSGAYDQVKQLGLNYAQQAVNWADRLQGSKQIKETLQSLAVYMMERMV